MLFTLPSMKCHRYKLGVCLLPLIIGQVIVTVSFERVTDIYVDHEYNQTSIDRWLSTEEKTDLEHKILRLLGLPEEPQNIEKKTITKRSGPKFLLDVYNHEVEYKQWYNNEEFKLDVKNSYTINQSDVIISFMAQQPHNGEGGKPDRVKRMWFDVSAVPVDVDIMLSAELRLYRGSEFNKKKNPGAFIVRVYRVVLDADGNRERHFVDSSNIRAGYTGWITLNVSESLQFWTKQPEENRGLYLSVISAEGTEARQVKPENIGIVGFDGNEERQPFMVGFYKTPEEQKILHRIKDLVTRHPRSTSVYSLDVMHYMEPNNRATPIARGSCGLRELYVNFKDIHWDKWILAPDGFDASYCSGECHYPPVQASITNHAIVQSVMHIHYPEIPEPCCAPRKYSDLQVLYYPNVHTDVLKRYQNMVVDECGCS